MHVALIQSDTFLECRSSLELRASDSVVTPYEHVKDLLLAEEIRLV